ncbi:Clostripain family protein [Sinomicrobium pectinilyticum]|uniref:Clostripain family protein n=1 Tax=Sinomicrobium pectinilyticum TaxID=1084421 RepID=A0A3N0EEJ4_SINP1|nr:clostripain-related cysteine peptidase [Sinomicrobium pectinilyticum]RNL86266.1 Clostripain family protein [Sinomicrobium pectinilyticum]
MKRQYEFPLGLSIIKVSMTVLFLAGCTQDDNLPDLTEPVSYTTLVYMAADNSMDSEVDYTLEQLKEGIPKSGGIVLVYLDREGEAPRLFRILEDGTEAPLMHYEEENSASAETLKRVLEETKELVPAERYGLVYWSHSMGWMPRDYAKTLRPVSERGAVFPRTRYLGIDNHPGEGNTFATVMEIDRMAAILPDHELEYIWFDVCLMAGVEPLYQLRNKCRYMVASPTEVLMEAGYDASGAPYGAILSYLFGGEEDLEEACRLYIEHYNRKKQEILRSATISLVDAGQLEGLYIITSDILEGKLESASVMETRDLQAYHQGNIPPVFFDFGDMIGQLGTTAQQKTLREQLERTVIYKAATDQFIELPIDPEHFSGLSCYVPLSKWRSNPEYAYYFNLDWGGVYGNE